MSDKDWTITQQDTTVYPHKWGTISSAIASGWRYSGRDEETDWSAWADNNPVFSKKNLCTDSHDWADTGLAKTWCKRCDITGRWVMGRVEIEREEKNNVTTNGG